MQFTYIARTLVGKEERGLVSAQSLEEARETLRKRELLVDSIQPTPPQQKPQPRPTVRFTTSSSPLTQLHPPRPAQSPRPQSTARPAVSPSPRPAPVPAPPTQPPAPKRQQPSWTPLQTAAPAPSAHGYVPLVDTLRLFAGWLLAWYALVYLLGSAAYFQHLPFTIPFVDTLFLSPLILRFTFATYLFLALTSLHKRLNKGIVSGLLLTIAGVGGFLVFHVNV